jgi:hypothetical protein
MHPRPLGANSGHFVCDQLGVNGLARRHRGRPFHFLQFKWHQAIVPVGVGLSYRRTFIRTHVGGGVNWERGPAASYFLNTHGFGR